LSIFNWFKKKEIKQQEVEIPAVLISQDDQAKPKKLRKPRVKKEKIPPAPKAEPKVDILKFDFDPADPKLGSIELDWNSEFVELLIKHGYIGNSEEEIVDRWLNDVCKNIASNEFQGTSVKANTLSSDNLVKRTPLGDGKTEIS